MNMTAMFPDEASDMLCEALPYIVDARNYIKKAKGHVVDASAYGHMSNQDEVKAVLKKMDHSLMILAEVMGTLTAWTLEMIEEGREHE